MAALARQIDPNARGLTWREPALAFAAAGGDVRAVETLLRRGALIDAAAGDGTTALQQCVGTHPDIASILLERGASARVPGGASVVAEAIAARDDGLARALIRGGASLQPTAAGAGLSPLDAAAMEDRPALVRDLLNLGAPARSASDNPLTYARSALVAGMLLRAGASVSARDRSGLLPLEAAALRGADAPRAASAGRTRPPPATRVSGARYRESLAPLLLSHGANPNSRDPEGHTPLMLAAVGGRQEDISTLIWAGAIVGASDHAGRTALMYARSPGAARALLRAGARVSARADNGDTPLASAIEQQTWGIVPVLLAAVRARRSVRTRGRS